MALPAPLRPLASAATLRCGVHLVVGGVVAAAYGLLATGFAQMYRDPQISVPVVTALVVVTAGIVLLPPFLHPVRLLEATAARTLLDVDLPQDPGRGVGATARGAAWFVLHLAAGTVATLALLVAIPLAVSLVAWHLGATRLDGALGPLIDVPAVLAVVLAALLVLVPPYVMWGLRALLRACAAPLLGPSPRERIARLEADKRELAARNALARDLHDSVGHALTVTTLQAAAAQRALDRDPEFVRSALAAIAATGRGAVAELDRVLGALRTEGPPPPSAAAARDRTLDDVPALVEEVRAAGVEISVLPADVPDAVPGTVSRAAYAILREGLTNALRHGAGPVEIAVAQEADGLSLGVTNALAGETRGRTGRGLTGMRERAEVLGGSLTWDDEDGWWRLRGHLPLEPS
ncbi:sensor histidine kinase [Georgenia sp. H159]|uniref:sensor histidine kinase n=1 Tax=Georgenia sp. H159 TaxID=3076115 RepID=UPI002D79568D|nr:histidine kinase [Georgenia sp. H159]